MVRQEKSRDAEILDKNFSVSISLYPTQIGQSSSILDSGNHIEAYFVSPIAQPWELREYVM